MAELMGVGRRPTQVTFLRTGFSHSCLSAHSWYPCLPTLGFHDGRQPLPPNYPGSSFSSPGVLVLLPALSYLFCGFHQFTKGSQYFCDIVLFVLTVISVGFVEGEG